MTTPPDTALACLDEGERELVERMEAGAFTKTTRLIRRLACELDDAKDGAEVLHEEIAKYRTQLSQRDAEIAELKGRIGEAVQKLRGWEYHEDGYAVVTLLQKNITKLAALLEGKGKPE